MMSLRSKYFLIFFGIPVMGLGILLFVVGQLYFDNKRLDLLDSHVTELAHVADSIGNRLSLIEMDASMFRAEIATGHAAMARHTADFILAGEGAAPSAQLINPDPVIAARAARVAQLIGKATPGDKFLIDKDESYVIERGGSLFSVYGFSRGLEDVWPKDVTTIRMIDRTGRVLASSKRSDVGQSLKSMISASSFEALAKVGLKRGSIEEQGRDGKLVSFSSVRSSDLLVVATTPKMSILRASESFLAQAVGSFFALLGLAALASIYFSNALGARFRDLTKVMEAVRKGDFSVRAPTTARDEIAALADHLNQTTDQLRNLFDSKALAARLDAELKTAKIVQDSLFPPAVNRMPKATVIGEYQPASEVSGDWWHTFNVDEKTFVLVADVTGHGIAAALLTSAAKAAVSMLQDDVALTPARLLTQLNRVILMTSNGHKQMTMFAACLETRAGRMSYSNASHECPYMILPSGEIEPLLADSGRRLGESLESTYTDQSILFEDGAILTMFTDGIFELRNDKDRQLSERSFVKMLKSAKDSSSSLDGVMTNLKSLMERFHAQPQLLDDITLVLFQYTSEINRER
jgi:serine phosphatase RsbU (regulator of sigma subunit)